MVFQSSMTSNMIVTIWQHFNLIDHIQFIIRIRQQNLTGNRRVQLILNGLYTTYRNALHNLSNFTLIKDCFEVLFVTHNIFAIIRLDAFGRLFLIANA